MSNKTPFSRLYLRHRSPGLILGPYEALLAILMCLDETNRATKDGTRTHSSYLADISRDLVQRVNYYYRRKLLRALLAFGYFDALSGMYLFGRYLRLHGREENLDEVYGELLVRNYGSHSPFAHSLESAMIAYQHPFTAAATNEDAERLAPAIIRALKRTGYTVEMRKRRTSGQPRYVHEAYKNEVLEGLRSVAQLSREGQGGDALPYLNPLIVSCFAMVDRAILLECLLLSVDAAGPAWLSNQEIEFPVENTFQIMEIVWSHVGWLPQPGSFREALSMIEDERIVGLQKDIQLWSQRVATGDIHAESELRVIIQEKIKTFRGKPWAAPVSRIITYLAVPISVADLLISGGMMGLGIAGLGTTVQLLADKLEANKKRHWLSLGSHCF